MDADLEVCVRSGNGAAPEPITTNPGEDIPVGWSPDGAWALFLSDAGSEPGAYHYDAHALHLAIGARPQHSLRHVQLGLGEPVVLPRLAVGVGHGGTPVGESVHPPVPAPPSPPGELVQGHVQRLDQRHQGAV
ncbi:MAG: hypothetical protein Q8N53_22610, partial [Longimicrobiales bacterium]|nr:hypothetical protein [Longimicrobiales bacterium]